MLITKNHLLLVAALSSLLGCGREEKKNADESTPPSDDNILAEETIDEIVVPPIEYYDEVMRYELSLVDDPANALATRPVLYLDFDGAEVPKGYSVGQSFIVCRGTAQIPASTFTVSQQDDIVARVEKFYRAAGSNIKVMKARPAARPYTTMVVGGSYRDLNCAEKKGVLGVAPLDGGNGNKNDTGFAFTRYVNNVKVVAETIAHEAGHSFGLDHVKENSGLMYYANSPNIIGFIVGTVRPGKKQNEPVILQRDVGKLTGEESDTPIATTSDDPNTPTPAGGNLGNTGTILGGLGSILGGINLGQIGLPGQGPLSGSILDSLLPIFGGALPIPGIGGGGQLSGLDSLLAILGGITGSGNQPLNLPGLIDLLTQLGGGANIPVPPVNFALQGSGSSVQDLSALLGLNNPNSVSQIIGSLDSAKSFLSSQQPGEAKDLLTTFVKVSHAQAYQHFRP